MSFATFKPCTLSVAASFLTASILCLAPALRELAAAEDPAPSSRPVFTGLMIDGKSVSGRIVALSADTITLEDAEHSARARPHSLAREALPRAAQSKPGDRGLPCAAFPRVTD